MALHTTMGIDLADNLVLCGEAQKNHHAVGPHKLPEDGKLRSRWHRQKNNFRMLVTIFELR